MLHDKDIHCVASWNKGASVCMIANVSASGDLWRTFCGALSSWLLAAMACSRLARYAVVRLHLSHE
eukprot:7843949-Prorocentrum_lima.AAC.1